jgi:hypothetical protein
MNDVIRKCSLSAGLLAGLALSLLAVACTEEGGDYLDPGDGLAETAGAVQAPKPILKRASKSSTVAITGDDQYVLMVNPEDDSVSIFATGSGASAWRTAKLTTGNEPSSVVIHPDDDTAFVANRAAATVVKITGIRSAHPQVSAPYAVGSEPTGLALSPTGAYLFVAELAEGRISVIRTSNMTVRGHIDAPEHPRAVAVTNDNDQWDDDELVIVPEFFGELNGAETADDSRSGLVRTYKVSDLSAQPSIAFEPLDSGFVPVTAPAGTPTVLTSPNQLWSVAVVGSKIYVPSVSASPAPPISFVTNVQPVAYVGDLGAWAEDKSARGTANLARLVRDQVSGSSRFFLADTVDVSFVGSSVGYYVSRGADVVQRVEYGDHGPMLGTPDVKQIELNTVPAGSTLRCQNPTGIVTAHEGGYAYVNCWVTRALGVIDFSNQSLAKTVQSDSIAASETDVQLGRRFYFTGRGRWSKNAWSDCGSCHPDGLSDNITWSFPAGPRQTTAMDGSFSHGPGAQQQRVFNWTAIFDEIHDFERNTRGVSGGLGAITTAPAGGCAGDRGGDISQEVRVDFEPAPPATPAPNPGGLGLPVKDVQNTTPGICVKDWDKVEAFVKTIRPARAPRWLDNAAVARGEVLFGDGWANAGCVKCHGGAGWTVSRRFYTPSAVVNDQLDDAPFALPPRISPALNNHTLQIQPELTAAGVVTAPEQVSCVIRNVQTFGPAALEKKDSGALAQGTQGYNVPSLYGMSLGAPYLHNGAARTLQDLFDNPALQNHILAGNPWWISRQSNAWRAKADLIAFILSIDPWQAEQAIPAGFDACPSAGWGN